MPSGGFRVGAGRPRKNQNESKAEGRNQKKPETKPKMAAVPQTKDVMAGYFAIAMKECADIVPSADDLRAELEGYIKARGCDGLVPPQTITDYVLNRMGFLACEAMNRKIGRMTKDLKLSPYVTAAQGYYKAMREDFNLVMQVINRYSGTQSEEQNEFLRLLTERGF